MGLAGRPSFVHKTRCCFVSLSSVNAACLEYVLSDYPIASLPYGKLARTARKIHDENRPYAVRLSAHSAIFSYTSELPAVVLLSIMSIAIASGITAPTSLPWRTAQTGLETGYCTCSPPRFAFSKPVAEIYYVAIFLFCKINFYRTFVANKRVAGGTFVISVKLFSLPSAVVLCKLYSNSPEWTFPIMILNGLSSPLRVLKIETEPPHICNAIAAFSNSARSSTNAASSMTTCPCFERSERTTESPKSQSRSQSGFCIQEHLCPRQR